MADRTLVLTMYVVCGHNTAAKVAETMNHIVTGFGLDGLEAGMNVETRVVELAEVDDE